MSKNSLRQKHKHMMNSFWPGNLATRRKTVINELMEGRKLANQILNVLLAKPDDIGSDHSAEDLVMKIMKSFTNSISILNLQLNEGEHDEVSASRTQADHISLVGSVALDARKSEGCEESCRSTSTVKDRRGSYKRRRTSETWIRNDPAPIGDGHQWRKYGQKVILNSKYPRSYFRCNHKYDEKCQAQKQVQRVQEDPPLYRTTYFRQHTCSKNFLIKDPEFILEDITTSTPKEASTINGIDAIKHEHPCFSSSTFPSIKKEFVEEKTCNNMNHNHSLSSDYIMSADHDHLTASEASTHVSRTTTFSSSSLVTDHGNALSGMTESVGFDDYILQFLSDGFQ